MHRTSFKDKVVVVTGAAGGIGKAIAKNFGGHGAKVGLLDSDAEGLRVCQAEFNAAGREAVPVVCDVTDEAVCHSAMRQIISRYGGIDVLVNNAGITMRDAFIQSRMPAYRRVMEVNFFGALHCTQAAIQSLIARSGMVIVISSIAGFAPLLGRSGYCASKFALHGLFETLRIELKAHNVHILIVCPTFVKTNLQKRALGGDGQVTPHPQSTIGSLQFPQHTAEAVYRAAVKRKELVVLTPLGKLAYWFSRLLPGSYAKAVGRQFKSELMR